MSFLRHPFWNVPADPMFVHRQTQVFHHKKQTAQQALNGNQLQKALELYTDALQIAQTLPHLFPEIPKILSNRSLVYYRQGKFQLALNEADHSINVNRLWVKGYWRAAQAHKELRQVDCALDAVIGGYNVSVSQEQEEEIISFLVEIVSIIITLRYDPKNLLKNSEIHAGRLQAQRKLLQRLASNNCWEGVSLLVMGVHAGPLSTLDAAAASCPVDNLSVGNLLKNTSILELKRFGVDLAVCLLRSGALYEDIEQKMEKPVIHVGLKVALDTGNISLIKLMFSQYLKTPETKNALDREGRTGFHVLVHSGKINDSIGETLLRLLINNGCRSSIPDRNGKLAIDYLAPVDIGFNILSTTTKVADNHVKVKINEIKEKGNIAFKNKKYKEALIFYNRAITMVKGYENLTREAAIVLTNRSIVHTTLHSVTEALEDAEEAVRCDRTWMKGHWKRGQLLRQKKLFRESFSAFLEGYWKGGGTASEKCNILVEAVASFSNITEKQELEASYKCLSKVSNEAWPEVLTRLSARGEWAAIRYLVLGIHFQYINGQVTPRGVARDVDLQGITYNTLFQYLESHEDPTSINDWITPLVLFLITQRGDFGSLLRFQPSAEDTPLSAVVRFCVLTGDIALLQNMPDNKRSEMMEYDGRGDSPFHTLFKMSRCPQGKLLANIVRLLLQKGVSPAVRDRSQLLPIDYVNPSNNKEVYDILRKCTQSVEREEQRQKQQSEQEKERQNGEKREEAEKRRQKKEEAVRGRHTRNKRTSDEARKKEPAKTLDYCKSRIEDATKFLLEKNTRQAYLSLAEVLKKVHMSEKHKEMEQKALDIVITSLGISPYPEIPNELVKIPHKLYEQIINGLAVNEKWRQMYFTVKEHILHYGDLSLPDFAKSMSLTKVIRHWSFQDSEQLLIDVVKCMLNGGAVLDEDGKLAILAAVQKSKFKVLEVLLEWGANPVHLTINQGDTPIHAALSIALERNKGNFSILKYFFDLYESDPDTYPMLDPAQTNSDGDSLFHLAAKAKYSGTTKKATKFLYDKKVNALVLNKEGKLPKHYLNSKKDKRLQFLVRKDVVKKHIEEMICNLPDNPSLFFDPKVTDIDEISNFQQKKKATTEKDISKTPTKAKEVDVHKPSEEQNKEKKYLQIDPQVFDNFEWEVECTADVWKTLRDKKVLPELKQRIIRKIQLLAKGEWTPHLCKELRNTPRTIKLYEVKLSKASRIIWELAIAFSPRLSEDAEQRLQYSDDEADQLIRGGRIYSEIIRVWDIVFDHDKIFKSVQRIIKSHSKGEKSIIQKKLKGVKQKPFKAGRSERIPIMFAESDLDADVNSLEILQRYYPPASSNETDYHILKFYNFDSNLVSHVLQNLEVKVDFPFRVTHLEHSIINLTSNAPILLLGRSGTGKTTCCLYRLWSKFVSYWTGAVVADSKLIPRCQIFHQKNDVVDESEDSEKDTSEEEEAENKEDGEEDQTYDHLHQIFITKNVVLCSEVQKNFKEMSNACDVVRHFVSQEEQPLPHRIQDIGDNQFPIFVTSKRLLLLLDASLKGPCFFERNDDGSLKVEIQGWAEPDGAFSFLSTLDAETDDENEEDEDNHHQYADDSKDNDNNQDTLNRPHKKVDPRREVTYKVFAEEVWPWISKKCSGQYHPSLIWMEIMSFITGSFEALSNPSGYLSKEEYFDLGRKRAPNFSGERENIYEMFKRYDHFKRQKLLFDEIDLVKNVFNRLKKEKKIKWVIHQIYVDETQDFTQAELCLLLRVCHSPNEMFLTGDTAQSIMRGISFRFEDLSSLFFYAKRSTHAIGKSSDVKVPKKVYQLTHNYRSHAGILSLASSILDLMVEFFPESFDRLNRDLGLFQGPRPLLLESCSFSDLSVLLRGHKRKAPHIDFGAHQAILVVNEASRDKIPKELNLGLILTIYEAKGLEFDDILLYNFFKDSQATKEWRIVTDFLDKLAATNEHISIHSSESLVSINEDILKLGDRPRPLGFDPNQHKVLNSELKHLYTAVTRARVNVWIFDEDPDKRAPMFEYFKARKLTRNITVAEVKNGSIEEVFAEQSSTEQWLQRGEEFMKQSLYEVAAKCFNRSENYHMEKIAKAHQLASLASRMKETPEDMNEAFLMAAEQFLECEQPNKAVICLQNSREKELVALLYEKMNQLEKAGKTYHKLKRPEDESRCYEQLGKFNLAVETLVENGLFEMAIDTLCRYKSRREELDQPHTPLPRILVENAPSHRHTVESLSYKAAEAYHRSKNKDKMMGALERLQDIQDRTDFLVRKNYIEEAAKLFQEAGMHKEAVDLYSRKGMEKEALQYAKKSQDKTAIGQSFILDSKIRLSQYKDFNDIEVKEKNQISENLNQAFYSLQDLDNKLAAGEAALINGQLTGRIEFINKAFWAFSNSRPAAEIGKLECMHWMIHNSDLYDRENLRQCVLGMQNLFENVLVLAKNNMENERTRLQEIFKFFGFYPAEEDNKLLYYPKQQPRALMLLPEMNKDLFICILDKNKVRAVIFNLLVKRGIEWKRILEDIITTNRNDNKQCPAFRLGEPCKNAGDSDEQSCPYLHAPLNPKHFDLLTEYDMLGIELEMHVHLGTENVLDKDPDFDESLFTSRKLRDRYMACNWLLEDLIPQNYHNVVISSEPDKARSLLQKLKNPNISKPSSADKTCICVQKRMFLYFQNLYDEIIHNRREHIKVFMAIRIVIHLLNQKIKLEDIILSFEKAINEEIMRKPESAIVKLGLEVDNSSDGETYVYSIVRRFCGGCDQIIRGNPSEALIQFTKFCTLLSNTGNVEVLPHYNQLLLWMEYFTTVAFCLTAKEQNKPNFFFVIPESYISVVYFIDAIFIQEEGVPTLEAVQRHILRKDIEDTSLFQELLGKLVDFVCGFTNNFKLNLLSHIFQSVKTEPFIAYDVCGVAERLLVLALVFVCNIGKSVFIDVENKLMSELCKIKIWEEYPSRLSEALKSVQQAGSPADVANALRILLLKRENDSLAYYSWDNSNKACGLRKKELKNTELFKEFVFEDKTFKAMQNPHEELSSEVNRDIKEDNEVGTTFSKEGENMDITPKEKEKSEMGNEVQNLSYRVARKISEEKRDKKINVFESIQVTKSGCGVCGVRFKENTTDFVFPMNRQTFNEFESSGLLQSPSPLQLPQANYKRVQQVQTNSSPDKVMDNPFLAVVENLPMFMSEISLDDANEETREEHEKCVKHKEMVRFYQHFRIKYMQEISDPLGEVRGFIQRYKLGSAEMVEKHFKEETYNIGILRRQRESVENKIETIIKGCDWQNGEIWGEVQEMIGSYHRIKDYVETEARKRKERSEKEGEDDSDKNKQEILDDDMGVIEPVVYEPKERRRKGTKKKKGQRR